VTASLPVGLYLATSDANAELVEFCPAEPFAAESRDRNYRPKSIACPDGAAPLMKPIAAKPGDTVLVSDKGIVVNGTVMPWSAALKLDGVGRKLKSWPLGSYTVATNELWVVSTYAGSYDSRYIGPIRRSQVRDALKPLWVIE
jgi:conjugative transfer signal peptidase TraF